MTKEEIRLFELGKKNGREEVIYRLKELLMLDECEHCKHEEREHN